MNTMVPSEPLKSALQSSDNSGVHGVSDIPGSIQRSKSEEDRYVSEEEEDLSEEDETDDEYEFQEDYVYDIASRLKEVNAQHFGEPLPKARNHKVRFAENPVERILCYSPTSDVDERLQMKRKYIMKLFAKDESDHGDDESEESALFSSSSDDDDFIDKEDDSESPLTGTSQPSEKIIGELPDNKDNISDELDNKIMELIERSVRSPDYQAGSLSAKSLGDQLKNTIQESLLKSSNGAEEVTLTTIVQESPALEDPEDKNNPVVTSTDENTESPAASMTLEHPPRNFSSNKSNETNISTNGKVFPSPNQSRSVRTQKIPPSPTRFIRKSHSIETQTEVKELTKKLPLYTGNDRSRYGLTVGEKLQLKELRERIKRGREEKARQVEETKKQRKIDAQKTFEAWLRNKEAEQKRRSPEVKSLDISSSQPSSESETVVRGVPLGSNQSSIYLQWLEGKKVQKKQSRLQHKLQEIEIEEQEGRHTRQDAQQAYKRWLRRKALESEKRKVDERKRLIESSLPKSELSPETSSGSQRSLSNRKQSENIKAEVSTEIPLLDRIMQEVNLTKKGRI